MKEKLKRFPLPEIRAVVKFAMLLTLAIVFADPNESDGQGASVGTGNSGSAGNYVWQTFSVPSNNFTLSGQAINLDAGWTNTTLVTNIQSLWNSTSAAFVLTTNISTNNIFTRPIIGPLYEKDVVVAVTGWGGTANTNVAYVLAPGIDGSNFDTNAGAKSCTALFNSGGSPTIQNYSITNMTITSAGYLELARITIPAFASGGISNLTFQVGHKKQSP